jgi:hypothetical protein
MLRNPRLSACLFLGVAAGAAAVAARTPVARAVVPNTADDAAYGRSQAGPPPAVRLIPMST